MIRVRSELGSLKGYQIKTDTIENRICWHAISVFHSKLMLMIHADNDFGGQKGNIIPSTVGGGGAPALTICFAKIFTIYGFWVYHVCYASS